MTIRSITATQHVRRMRGGAQSHLMRCSDNNLYVVKFKNNPQHTRVLANELFASLIARDLGLPVPEPAFVTVAQGLIDADPNLRMQFASESVTCSAGVQFGSRYALNPPAGYILDYMPVECCGRLQHVWPFVGAVVLHAWLANSDYPQAVFVRLRGKRNYRVLLIDHGHCFGLGKWTLAERGLPYLYRNLPVYRWVCGWESFEPWLSQAETFPENKVRAFARAIPAEWYEGKTEDLERLVEGIMSRRARLRDLIAAVRFSSQDRFPLWTTAHTVPDIVRTIAHFNLPREEVC